VGANIGNHSINLSKSSDKVIAIEPNSSCVMLLRASLNIIKNVEVVPIGVCSIKETLTLRFIKDHIGSGTFMRPQSGNEAQNFFNEGLKKLNGLDNFNEIQNELNKYGYISFYNLIQSRRSHDLFLANVFNMIFRLMSLR